MIRSLGIIFNIGVIFLFLCILVSNSCSFEKKKNTDCSKSMEDGSVKMDYTSFSLTLMIESYNGTEAIVANDTIKGHYAQVIMCNETAVIHGFAIESAEQTIDNSNFQWLSQCKLATDYSIRFRVLSSRESAFLRESVERLEGAYHPTLLRLQSFPIVKLYINNKLVVVCNHQNVQNLPDDLLNIIYAIFDIAVPLWQVDGIYAQ